MTSQLTRTNKDCIGNYEKDKVINKFSYSMNKVQHDTTENSSINKKACDVISQASPLHKNASYNQLIENICQISSSQSSINPKVKFGEQTASDRAKFFNTLKSLFAIFDPECRGFIDINELNNLGAQRNEILNDVIGYLINKKGTNYEYTNSLYFVNGSSGPNKCADSRSSSGNSSRSSSTNSSQLKSEDTKSSFIKNLTSKKDNSSPATHRIAKKLKKLETKKNTSSSSTTSPSSTKSSLSSSSNHSTHNLDGYYVTFEEFINAADIVLDKRRKEKMQHLNSVKLRSQTFLDESQSAKSFSGDTNESYRNGHFTANLYQGASTSLNNLYKSTSGYAGNKISMMHQTMQPPPPPPPPIDYNTIAQRPKIQNSRLSLNNNMNIMNQQSNYMPLLNSLQNQLNQNSSTSSVSSMNGATLSQAFENITNFDPPKNSNLTHNKLIKNDNANFINNANSFDLTSLIDKESSLLQQGLNDIDIIKQWFTNQLIENRSKQSNIQQLKRQNLFSIDKMLIDLKNLNDLNTVFEQFLIQKEEKNESFENSVRKEALNSTPQQQYPPLPTYKDYVENFDLNKTDTDIDVYLKEKSEKIENLQREKSNLIRRLFEMKSESADLNRNIIKLQNTTTPMHHNLNPSNYANTSNMPMKKDTKIHQNYEHGLPKSDHSINNRINHPNTNPHIITNKLHSKSSTNPLRSNLNNSTICNFIELPNGGFNRDSSEKLTSHSYYHQKQHNFKPMPNRSPI